MSVLRVLYKSLLRAARVYDQHAWSRAQLFAEPAMRSALIPSAHSRALLVEHEQRTHPRCVLLCCSCRTRLPSIEWYLGNDSCVQLVRSAFRDPLAIGQVSTA